MNELLQLKYIRLEHLVVAHENPKLHDIGLLVEAIKQYGFRVPIVIQSLIDHDHLTKKQEQMLEDGIELFAILAGHGRREACYHIKRLVNGGEVELPRGLGMADDGELLIPATFGNDLETMEDFEAFVIDDNSLALMGGNFTALDVSRMYDSEKYLAMLKRTIDTVKTVDGDDLDLMIKMHTQALEEPLDLSEEIPDTKDDKRKMPSLKLMFDTDIDLEDFKTWMSDKQDEYPSRTTTGFIVLDAIGLV